MNLTPSPVQHSVKTIRFVRRGEVVNLGNVPPDRTLLALLREDLGLTGTKEGCGEGDCGACTVVLGQIEDGALRFRAINSCIRLAHSIDGMALWTVEDLAAPDGRLHPAQEAMVQCHASQCGFCTPGFVMSLFGMYERHIAPTLATSCAALPPEGALRLRPGEAGSAALAGVDSASTLEDSGRLGVLREGFGILLRCLYPAAPHLTHSLWNELGYAAEAGELLDAPWPEVDASALQQDEIELMLQINGKLRGAVTVPAGADKATIEAAALATEAFIRQAAGAPAKKVIVVPGRLVNIVV